MNLYANLFTGKADAGLNSAIMYTLVIALVAALCSTILGTLAAIGIYNMRARQRKVVSLMNSIPMINPDIITGISLFLLFVALGVSQGLATVCIAHVVFCTPCGAERVAATEPHEPQHLRGGTGLGSHSGTSTEDGDATGVVAGDVKRIYFGVDSFGR